jgi:hypothetical protein
MGLFTRNKKRIQATIVWRPDDDEPQIVPAAVLDDEDSVSEDAYAVTFTIDGAPAATLTVWAYPVYGPASDPGTFMVRYRCQYQVDSCALVRGDRVINTATGETGTVAASSDHHDVHVDTDDGPAVWAHDYVTWAEGGLTPSAPDEPWTHIEVAPDPAPESYDDGVLLGDLEAADYVAFTMAALLACIARGPGDELLGFFDWDGQPFETGN